MLAHCPNKLEIYPRPLHSHHWQALNEVINKPQMEPSDFLNHWEMTYKDLAKICNCSENLVKRWFMTSAQNRRNPTVWQKERLAIAHQTLLQASRKPF